MCAPKKMHLGIFTHGNSSHGNLHIKNLNIIEINGKLEMNTNMHMHKIVWTEKAEILISFNCIKCIKISLCNKFKDEDHKKKL